LPELSRLGNNWLLTLGNHLAVVRAGAGRAGPPRLRFRGGAPRGGAAFANAAAQGAARGIFIRIIIFSCSNTSLRSRGNFF
jgi:hypothetical protein